MAKIASSRLQRVGDQVLVLDIGGAVALQLVVVVDVSGIQT